MKIIICFIIAFLPFNFLRIYFYNFIKDYKILNNSKIGFGSIIIAKRIKIYNSKLGKFNFIKINNLKLDKSNVSNFNIINNFNQLECINESLIGSYNKLIGENIENGNLKMDKSPFTTSHLVNVNNRFELDKDVVFGGKKSLINIGLSNEPTIINRNVYFGSSIYLSAGLKIVSEVLIGSGTIVSESLNKRGLFVSHKIRKII